MSDAPDLTVAKRVVAATRQAQGLPSVVEDDAVLDRITAALPTPGVERPGAAA